ncbi:hypothetical protein [Streptomyces chartreusis]|uniref:Uncharacterized protein n=1 Tax=Streptomyces chartreusis TaxID=1969 RepID=A0A7H8TA32_STRCX|nr:hypothetical protein [Streptomyces chartreusis]QKZ18810.1 hypothetical protein HUT05_16430 [Streptomyces chartreusis]
MQTNRWLRGVLPLATAGLLVCVTGAASNAAPAHGGGAAQAVSTRPTASFPKQDPAQCTAFSKSADAKKAAEDGKSVIGLWTSIFDLPTAQKLYDAYLTPGPVTHTRTSIGGKKVLAEFRNAGETKKAVSQIVSALKNKIATTSPAFGTDHSLRKAGLGSSVPIAWNNLETTPGFIAGGLSGVELADGTSIKDSRAIAGKYSLVKQTVNGKTKVTLNVHRLSLTVRDSIDFCPGNLSGGSFRTIALGLSRLERTPYVDKVRCSGKAKCYYARPALFKVNVPLNDVSVDVTETFSAKAATAGE